MLVVALGLLSSPTARCQSTENGSQAGILPTKEAWEGTEAGESRTLTIKGVEYTFHWCPAGSFVMGSPETETGRYSDEPQHRVTLSRGYWLLETEVTQGMWESVMGTTAADQRDKRNKALQLSGIGADYPMYYVNWQECQEFIEKLSQEPEIPAGYKLSLPTEAQWEYACRAGTETQYNFGNVLNGDQANCDGNYPYGTSTKGSYLEGTAKVRTYAPNGWGLYDTHGNVWEWCLDGYDREYYAKSPAADPAGDPVEPIAGSGRVLRGGGWDSDPGLCRSAYRGKYVLTDRYSCVGFRLALVRE